MRNHGVSRIHIHFTSKYKYVTYGFLHPSLYLSLLLPLLPMLLYTNPPTYSQVKAYISKKHKNEGSNLKYAYLGPLRMARDLAVRSGPHAIHCTRLLIPWIHEHNTKNKSPTTRIIEININPLLEQICRDLPVGSMAFSLDQKSRDISQWNPRPAH